MKKAVFVALALGLTAAAGAQQQVQIDFVNMGGNDCGPCKSWRKLELPKLQAMPEFAHIRYHYVTKSIKAPVPPAFFFPSESKHLQPALAEAGNGRTGSPQQAILVNGKVVDYWWGTGLGDAQALAEIIRTIKAGEAYPRPACQKVGPISGCEVGSPDAVRGHGAN
jgi:hypothetical protein